MAAGDPQIPPVNAVYTTPPVRHRRFDDYCHLGCAAIALALQDAGMERVRTTRSVGIIASTRYGCFETDVAFYATAREENGIYASPSLFSYTLPGIAISEAAIHFRLTGPIFTVNDPRGQRGYQALRIVADLLLSGVCRTALAGWLDAGTKSLKHAADGDDGVRGAVFLVLSTGHAEKTIQTIREKDFELFAESGTRISSILDLVT
jgi:3-oxoacyl-[acyl-carrier-protein] synthase II